MDDIERQHDEPLAERLFRRARGAMDRAPGGQFVLNQARAVEDVFVQHLKNRLESVNGHAALPAPGNNGERNPGRDLSLAARMEMLRDQSLDQTQDSARYNVFSKVLDQLVPDEVRILTCLSDGSSAAVSHLVALGRKYDLIKVMPFESRLGNECGVMLLEAVPYYLNHLTEMGLINGGAEDKEQRDKYESIENGTEVRKAFENVRKEMRMKPVFIREVARLSPFGAALMSACGN